MAERLKNSNNNVVWDVARGKLVVAACCQMNERATEPPNHWAATEWMAAICTTSTGGSFIFSILFMNEKRRDRFNARLALALILL